MTDSTCTCYICTEPVYGYTDDGHKYIINNLHDEHQQCENCGRLKTEYCDRGSYGIYKCWWCTKRTK